METLKQAVVEVTDEAVDRLSDLPQPIVHHILSYLPTKDVYKTSALSKTFLSWWSSFPVIVLNYYDFKPQYPCNHIEEFLDSLDHSIQRRDIETVLQKFKLKLPEGHTETDHRINEAIDFALRKRVKELDLDWDIDYWFYDPMLPPMNGSLNSITRLNLRGLDLNNCSDLLVRCPLIERLQVRYCSGLKYFIFSNTTIRSIEFIHCSGLENVTINLPSLEKFTYNGLFNCCGLWRTVNCTMDISNCILLKVLSLSYAIVSDEWVEHTIPLLGHLEDLRFIGCGELGDLKIYNENMKRLTLAECVSSLKRLEVVGKNLEFLHFNVSSTCKITYDAPQLVSVISSNAETSSRRRKPADQIKVSLSIQANNPLPGSYFVALRDFIGCFPSCNDLTLICTSNENLVIPDRLRGNTVRPLYCPGMKTLTIRGFSSISEELVDGLLWLFPSLHTLCFASDDVERSLKFRRNNQIIKDDRPMCCSNLLRKCWCHYYKIVKLKNFDTAAGTNIRKYFEQNGKEVGTWT